MASLDMSMSEITSNFSNNSIAYICGFVIRKVWIKIKCESCRKSMISADFDFNMNKQSSISVDDATNYISYQNALRLIL